MNFTSSAVGIDIGTSRVVLATKENDYQFQTQLNAFVTIPHNKITEAVLKRENVPHVVENGRLLIFGNESERFADLLSVETRRPMTRGVLNPGEPESVAVMRHLLNTLLGDAPRRGQRVSFSVPAAPLGSNENTTYHEATIRQILEELGCGTIQPVNEALAVIYSDLEDSNFTGIGISCGGGLCNVCLAYLSVPVLSFSVGKAGDYIDHSASQVTGELANRVRIAKESGFQFASSYTDKVHQVLSVYYDDMIQTLVAGLRDAFTQTKSMPKLGRPLPLVLSGGTTTPAGFKERFEKHLRATDFPVPIAEIRMANSPLNATAKGALVHAMSEL
jgi:hypothetical protein